jgi:ABC-2 type transport system permease protein
MIYKIARAELKTLFFSPVAWLVIVIFTFQVGMQFSELLERLASVKEHGGSINAATSRLFARGICTSIQQYLYLYIPFLTMGLISRETGSGSIKLLYSSPVSTTQIVLGKFFSMMIYGFILLSTVFVLVLVSFFTVESLDVPAILSAWLGLYLLLCTYAAIGTFMSTLTSYQVVAAVGTLLLLGGLSHVGGLWQGVEIVRDLTYWLAINGRAGTLINGLLFSEDILYFITVSALFLAFAVIYMRGKRRKSTWHGLSCQYLFAFLLALGAGYLSSRPVAWVAYDATHNKGMSAAPSSREVLERIEGKVTITGYANALDDNWSAFAPANVNADKALFRPLLLVNPRLAFRYVYFYDTIPGVERLFPELPTLEGKVGKIARLANVDSLLFCPPEAGRATLLAPENRRTTRLLALDNGKSTFLRFYNDKARQPREVEISAALKRLSSGPCRVAFVTGHGEREINRAGERHYHSLASDTRTRLALINQGFDVFPVTLEEEMPGEVDIVVIADPRRPFSPGEIARLDAYINNGGNLLLAGEPGRGRVLDTLAGRLGVRFLPGQLVSPSERYLADFVLTRATAGAPGVMPELGKLERNRERVTMPGCTGLEYSPGGEFAVIPLLATDSTGTWSSTGPVDLFSDTLLVPAAGEVERAIPAALALSRQVGGKEQRVLVLGDADCLSGAELTTTRQGLWSGNRRFVFAAFHWLSRGEFPVDPARLPLLDTDVHVTSARAGWIGFGLTWVFPLLFAAAGTLGWLRRRGR